MNWNHLGRSGSTDVIAFSLDRPTADAPLVGDVYIAPEVVRAQARRLSVPIREEFARVLVHGVLHTVGHDHPEDNRRESSAMWQRQERLVADARRGGLW
jgi:probable rRNA maturation factor